MAATHLPAAFWVLFAGTLLNRLGSVVLPVLSIYLVSRRQIPPAITGLVVSGFGLGAMLAGFVGGYLADRVGRRPTLLVALTLGAVAMIGVGLAEALPWIFVSVFALGLFGEMYRPAVSAALADLVPSEQRTLAFGYLHWGVNLGFSIAAVAAGWIVEHDFRLLFWLDAATTLGFAALVWWRLPETRPADLSPRQLEHPFVALADGTFALFLLATLFIVLVFHQFGVSLPLDLLSRGIPPRQFGMLVAVNGVLIVLLQPLFSRRAGTLPPRAMMVTGALLTGLGFGLHGLLLSIPGVVVCIVIWTLGEIVLSPVSSALISEAAPPAQQARYQGGFQMAHGLGAAVAPAAGLFLLGAVGATALWATCLLLGTAGALLYGLVVPRLRRRGG